MSPHFSLSVRECDGNGGSAAVISKKTARLSVSRHLLKRRMLAVLRPYTSLTRAIVAYARPGAASLSFVEVKRELEELLARVAGDVR